MVKKLVIHTKYNWKENNAYTLSNHEYDFSKFSDMKHLHTNDE